MFGVLFGCLRFSVRGRVQGSGLRVQGLEFNHSPRGLSFLAERVRGF